MYHEELESLAKFIPGIKSLRFRMTFGDQYLTYLKVIQNLGLSRIDEVEYEGHRIVPLKFLKSLLPDPGSLAADCKGCTSIGCLIKGKRNGQHRPAFLYNVCSHEGAYHEVGSQAVSYTTGVPVVAAATLIAKGIWQGVGVLNIEQMNPDPFLAEAARLGLPWQVSEEIDWPPQE
jgi:saccharopine dehydrogenase (NAD+, L-lysine forming)